ncbi:cytochrome c1 1, heme protein, mitochondrial-like [Lathyrus oleraceus]|uniref:cytochrome c1 1, heme protein, mitochondrial-like n=1 Tax=Pisum sativum TaxID=3888 RepID=UPI001FC3F0A5|nr:cytochrome c1 1, heme protein, mitochondrial-like [Pisum sativum]
MDGGVIQQLLRSKLQYHSPNPLFVSSIITKKDGVGSTSSRSLKALALIGDGVSGLLGFVTTESVDEAEHGLASPSDLWPHDGILSSYDCASIRRGYQVYTQVYASCHSMSLISYRDLVSVAYTEGEVKAMAAEIEVEDGPNDEGEMFTRPGKLSDRFPQPYANESAARFANGGAYPPDRSLVTKARYNGQNYVFSLLTGYRDPLTGVVIREGLHYKPHQSSFFRFLHSHTTSSRNYGRHFDNKTVIPFTNQIQQHQWLNHHHTITILTHNNVINAKQL